MDHISFHYVVCINRYRFSTFAVNKYRLNKPHILIVRILVEACTHGRSNRVVEIGVNVQALSNTPHMFTKQKHALSIR